MSAFSCGPDQGSEPGIGWNWAVEAARQGHDVLVITQSEFKCEIRRELQNNTLPSKLRFDFFTPQWIAQIRDRGCSTRFASLTWQVVHFLWQVALLRYVRKTYSPTQFDIVHHITLGGVRHPTLLGDFGPPLVLGPLGGGETAPWSLRKHYPWSGWLKDLARDTHTALLKLDPITKRAASQARLIYAKTPQSRTLFERSHSPKLRLALELGTNGPISEARSARDANTPLRILYAGQFVYWKGMGLGLRAVAQARAAGHNVHLTMVGNGPEEQCWRRLANQLSIDHCVTWRGWVPHIDMGPLYDAHDLFLFPSLHDSSGNVVLEALTRALPVVCLNLGGPAQIVDPTCGRIIAAETESGAVSGITTALCEFAAQPDVTCTLSLGATRRARDFLWPQVISEFYTEVADRLIQDGAPSIRK